MEGQRKKGKELNVEGKEKGLQCTAVEERVLCSPTGQANTSMSLSCMYFEETPWDFSEVGCRRGMY